MEENTITMQALVMAMPAMGHNSFFKNNYLFPQLDRRQFDHRLSDFCP